MTRQRDSETTGNVVHIVDSDQHRYASRSLWADCSDGAARHDALSLVDDELGYKRLTETTSNIFMFCSDYPHSERTVTPLDDYRRMGCAEHDMPDLFRTNIHSLLHHDSLLHHWEKSPDNGTQV